MKKNITTHQTDKKHNAASVRARDTDQTIDQITGETANHDTEQAGNQMESQLDGGLIDSAVDELLDAHDRQILSLIQSGFPLESSPYAVLGKQTGLTAEDVLERVRNLRRRGVIRRIGANFQSSKLGFRSTLCAAKVPPEKLDMFAKELNSHVEVTHNYLRNHDYNIWFTCIAPSWEAVCSLLEAVTQKTGIPILNLPATKLFKIKVEFSMD